MTSTPASRKRVARPRTIPDTMDDRPIEAQLEAALAALKKLGSKKVLDSYPRYGIVAPKAFGIPVGDIQKLAKTLGTNHELAQQLWASGWYEARLLCAFVDDPAQVTPRQMDQWCGDFDNWGVCDTICFKLFDHTPHVWTKIEQWNDDPREFVKRASYALIASLAVHGKSDPDERFLESLVFIERAAADERNFVKKGVSWALRALGRRNTVLHEAAVAVAARLVDSPHAAARWVGKDAFRELTSAPVVAALTARRAAGKEKGGSRSK